MALEQQLKPWKGDFDGMAERRIVRALVVYSRMLYFLDGAEQHGVTYDTLKEFENVINKQLDTKALKVHVAFIPVTRDQLQPALLEGRGDIAAANLTAAKLESVRIAKLRKQAETQGLDPNVWFRNVEYVAAKDIGQETVQYVSNIYKYYFAYRQVVTLRQRKKAVADRS